MRILQLIDSLDVGGAERMAVNYANALADKIPFSGLAATRKEGPLKTGLNANVAYFFAEKKSTFDLQAAIRIKNFCRKNNVDIIQAHGSTFFIAGLVKLMHPRIKIIWHDHNGDRSSQNRWSNKALFIFSKIFTGIIVVNKKIENWVRSELGFSNVIYLPNFTESAISTDHSTNLYGSEGKRILYLANLRRPKNHQLVVAAASKIVQQFPDWTFHFIGNDLEDEYSRDLRAMIIRENLNESVYLYGLKQDTQNCISQADICVIASDYEGLPVSLLEYGLQKKAVLSTSVGEIPQIISNGVNGILVKPGSAVEFAQSLTALISDPQLRNHYGAALFETITKNHSEEAVLQKYFTWIKGLAKL